MNKIENSIVDNNFAVLPNGWEIGNLCVMITNKKKGYTQEYTIQGFNGKYFELRDKRGGLHRASVSRMFKSRDEAIQSWQQNPWRRTAMNISELIASLQRTLDIYGDIQCVLLEVNGNITPLDGQPVVKYEQDDELLDFTDEKLSLKDMSDPVLLINP